MGFLSNLVIAILGLINPVLAFAGSAVKYIVSSTKNAGLYFVLDLVGVALPGGVVKDLMLGMVADAIEASSLNSAVSQITPFNDVVLKCDHCSNYSHYYVKRVGNIVCKDCLEKNIDDKIVKNDRIFLMNKNISSVKSDLKEFNRLSVSTKNQPSINVKDNPNIKIK